MPDFFQGEALPIGLYPPDTEEKRAVAKEFVATKAGVGKNVGKLLEASNPCAQPPQSHKLRPFLFPPPTRMYAALLHSTPPFPGELARK